MKAFYDFLTLLEEDFQSYEDKKTFTIEFEYNNKLDDFINFSFLTKVKNYFSNCASLYVKKILELNMFDFLEDEQDFNSEFSDFSEMSNFKLVILKSDFIKKILDIQENILFFTTEINLINWLDKDVIWLEENCFKEYKKNIFIIGNSESYFYNDFYMVSNLNREDYKDEIKSYCEDTNKINTEGMIKNRNKVCNWIDGSHYLTPECFYIDIDNSTFKVSDQFKLNIYKKTIDNTIPFIANFTGYIDKDYLSIINGNKRVEIKYDLTLQDYEKEHYDNLFKLYFWIYENGTFDKINICRNVISILVAAKCQGSEYKTILLNSKWLVKSVEDNFADFLNGNIEEFFKEKNALVESLRKNISGTNNQIAELTKLTITNITSLIGVIIAGVVGYIAKGDYTLIKILSFLYLIFLYINSIFNIPISIVRVLQYKNDFQSNKELYLANYTDDVNIKKMTSRNILNIFIFKIYTICTILIIGLVTYFIVTTDILSFIKRFQ